MVDCDPDRSVAIFPYKKDIEPQIQELAACVWKRDFDSE